MVITADGVITMTATHKLTCWHKADAHGNVLWYLAACTCGMAWAQHKASSIQRIKEEHELRQS